MDLFELSATGLRDVIVFLFPGFVFMYLFFYQIPDRKKSDLTTIVISVIASTLLGGLSQFLLSYFFTLPTDQLLPISFWTSLTLAVVFSMLIARFMQSENHFFKRINHTLFRVDYYPFGTLWNAFFKMRPDSYVKVTLTDGRSYVGKLGRVSNDTNDDHQALELLKPFIYDSERRRVNRITETDSMFIQGASIAVIEKITDENAKILYKL